MKKYSKDALIKARADESLVREIEWAAAVEKLNTSDIVRRACAFYVQKLKSQATPPLGT